VALGHLPLYPAAAADGGPEGG